ncbi:MAG: hypothetical protein B7Z75_06635 [Acidocella sp. 20-57-95]|nr:MAG: hypothetical protein B7Z75_06635 [Acidocella sp. 20-57-95]HQT64820.1 dienelactone hydrolase family protein [Acidocella sp.]
MVNEQHIILPNNCKGYLFFPSDGPMPENCLIVFHERYGLVQHTLDICKRIAAAGYTILAPDLFSLWDGDKDALKRGETRAIISDTDAVTQINCWIDYLREQKHGFGEQNFVLMGVCQSGRYPIVVASKRTDIAACIVFYGATHDRDWASNELQPHPMWQMIKTLQTPVLFVFAERDHTISLDNVARIRTTLEAANISYRMRVVPDVPHGFLNDTMPGRYRSQQAEEAWRYLFKFLDDVLVKNWPNDRVEWDLHSIKSRDYNFHDNIRLE